MAPASLTDVMLTLGKLLEGQERSRESLELLREEFQDEKRAAHESRSAIHRRLDDQAGKVAHLETTVALSGQIDAQLRDQIVGLKETVEKNHKAVTPALDDWRNVKALGLGLGAVLLAAGVSVASIYALAWNWAVMAMRHLFRIN